MILKSMLNKVKIPVTNRKPDSVTNAGNYTVQVYGNKVTVGIRTGIKPGSHFGGSGYSNPKT